MRPPDESCDEYLTGKRRKKKEERRKKKEERRKKKEEKGKWLMIDGGSETRGKFFKAAFNEPNVKYETGCQQSGRQLGLIGDRAATYLPCSPVE